MTLRNEQEIAEALTSAWGTMDTLAERIQDDWEPKNPAMSLKECFGELADIWARDICGDGGIPEHTKIQSLSVHVSLKLQKKQKDN